MHDNVPPIVVLPSRLPRRIYAPLFAIGDGSTRTDAGQIYEMAKNHPDQKMGLYWKWRNKDGVEGWRFASVDIRGGRIPPNVWQESVSFWRLAASPDEEDERLEIGWSVPYIDISFGAASADTCGLIITFNPQPDSSAIHADLLLVTSLDRHFESPQNEWDCRGKTALAIFVPELALIAGLPDDAKMPEVPPGEGFFKSLFSFIPSKQWRVRPKPFLVSLVPTRRNPREVDGCILALDFGTAGSTVALLPALETRIGPLGDGVPAPPLLRDLASWTHVTYEPLFDKPISAESVIPRKIECHRHQWLSQPSAAPKLPGAAIVFPHSQVTRAGWKSLGSPTARSLIFALPDIANELVTSKSDDSIGQEAQDILTQALQNRQHVEWDRFLFGPKSLIGDEFRPDKSNHSIHSFRRYRKIHPIELYLSELLDEAMFRCAWEERLSIRLLGPLKKAAFSYPVTWTKDQRDAFMRYLTNAIENSAMSELLPNGSALGLVREDHALDEATAAFMGFVLERYAGLDGDALVQMLLPFDPNPTSDGRYPQSANILIFDCGEGTTDVVWLELTDRGDNKPVESSVLCHFAMDMAGLEVTRCLAERLKDLLLKSNPQLRDLLRTNLHDPGIDQCLLPQDNAITVESYRRRLAFFLFEKADAIKVSLASGPCEIPWSQIINKDFMPGVKIDIPSLTVLEPADLTKIVQEVFAPASDQIRTWFSREMPRLDMVLFSGRSCQLPELRETILAAIPVGKQPYIIDVVDPRCIRLDEIDESCPAGEKSKTVVCTGLVLNHWNSDRMQGRPLRCKPIDERRRTRAIGLMATTVANTPLSHFADQALLVQPDNKAIDSKTPLGPIKVTNPQSSGFFVGINFGGVAKQGSRVDPVRPLCRVDLHGGQVGAFDELHFYFSQSSATQIRLRVVRVIRKSHPSTDLLVKSGEIRTGSLSIQVKYDGFNLDHDFRTTGRIHSRLDE